MKEQLKDLLIHGFIRISAILYGGLIPFVPKMNSSWLMCIDCRDLNKQEIKYQFLHPGIDSSVEEVGLGTGVYKASG